MKDANAEKSRLRWLDFFRGAAVLWMIEVHTFNSFLRPEILGAGWFAKLNFVNGLVAPAFLLIAGVLQGRLAHRAHTTYATYETRRKLTRIGQLFLLGYLMHLPNPITGSWADLFRQVDILQCMAMTMLVALGLQRLGRLGKWALLAMALFFVFAAPQMSFIHSMPVFLAGYVNRENGSLFPLFPWAGFFLAGWICNGVKAKEWLVGAVICWLLASGHEFMDTLYPPHDYYLVGPGFFFERLGWVMAVAAACQRFIPAGINLQPGGPSQAVLRMVVRAGETSLAIYVIHLQLINVIRGGMGLLNLPLKTGVAGALLLFVAIAILALRLTALLALRRVAPACRWLGARPASA